MAGVAATDMIASLVVVGMLLHMGSAGKIASINLVPEEIDIQVGSRLEIPCQFAVEDQKEEDKMEMEWGMMPANGGAYRSLVFIYNLDAEEMVYHHDRASLYTMLTQRGNCSLVIDPTMSYDSGIYEVHLRINGDEYGSTPVVYVNVSEVSGNILTTLRLLSLLGSMEPDLLCCCHSVPLLDRMTWPARFGPRAIVWRLLFKGVGPTMAEYDSEDNGQNVTTRRIHRGSRVISYEKVKDLFTVDMVNQPVRSMIFILASTLLGLIISGAIVACLVWFIFYQPKQMYVLRTIAEAFGSMSDAGHQ